MLSLAEFVKEKRNEVKLTQEDLKINQCRSQLLLINKAL